MRVFVVTKDHSFVCRCAGPVDDGLYQDMNPSGLLLLSTTEISDVLYVDYHPNTTEIVERGYLKAEVHVGCRAQSYYRPTCR